MINEIIIENFKCFKKCKIKLKKINIFCGSNSSGKSSINQSLLFLLQNNNKKTNDEINTNGDYVHFDEWQELKNVNVKNDADVRIRIINNKKEENSIIIYLNDGKIKCKRRIEKFTFQEEKNIFYLSANRIGPEDVYVKDKNKHIGISGENSIGFLARNKDEIIDEKYVFYKNINTTFKLIDEINYWLDKIIGEKISTEEISKTNKSTATYYKEGNNLHVRNVNTGSGLSYVISVLTIIFSFAIQNFNNNPLIIIENPEIHLHPLAQIKLMDFLISMSNYCQLIIETHSDHIIKHSILNNSDSQIIKFKDFKPENILIKTQKNYCSLSIGEIKWLAFDLPTIDYHSQLFSYIHEKFSNIQNKPLTLNELDDEIRKTTTFMNSPPKYETNYQRYRGKKGETETLPLYIRNFVSHPYTKSKKRFSSNDPDIFNQSLTASIDMMIKIIEEKNW